MKATYKIRFMIRYMMYTIYRKTVYLQYLHILSRKFTCPLKRIEKGPFFLKDNSSSNHSFSGDMLIFRGGKTIIASNSTVSLGGG